MLYTDETPARFPPCARHRRLSSQVSLARTLAEGYEKELQRISTVDHCTSTDGISLTLGIFVGEERLPGRALRRRVPRRVITKVRPRSASVMNRLKSA